MIAAFWRKRASAGGFSMIEVMAAIGIFSIITLGVTPLIISSVRGSALNRSFTQAKNLVTQAMERARGLPFYESVKNQAPPKRLDVLDFYFPDRAAGFASNTFTTTCTSAASTPAASGALACPPKNVDGTSRIPAGYTLTYRAQFIKPNINTNPQTFAVVAPATTYNWNSVNTETPPAYLLKLNITATWQQSGQPRSFDLQTLISDKDLNPDRLRGDATVNFVLEVSSAYRATVDGATSISNLRADGGALSADIDVRSVADAKSEVTPVHATLTREAAPGLTGDLLNEVTPLTTALDAPPNAKPTTTTSGSPGNLGHSDLGNMQIFSYGPGSVNFTGSPGVEIVSELPNVLANFQFGGGPAAESFGVTNQALTGVGSPLLLDSTQKMVSHVRAARRLSGSVTAVATALAPQASRKVETTAHLEASSLRILPTTFIATTEKSVVVIEDFIADLTCRATGDVGLATGTWTATLRYYADTNPNDDIASGAYVSQAISGSTTAVGADPLIAIRTANPMVYDAPLGQTDLYLFQDAAAGKVGYLSSWSSQRTLPSQSTLTNASVDLTNAISIQTALTDPANPQTSLNVTLGKASCEAVDKRA